MTQNQDATNCDGFLVSDDIRTGFISEATFTNKPVQYSVVDSLAVFESCITFGYPHHVSVRVREVK